MYKPYDKELIVISPVVSKTNSAREHVTIDQHKSSSWEENESKQTEFKVQNRGEGGSFQSINVLMQTGKRNQAAMNSSHRDWFE